MLEIVPLVLGSVSTNCYLLADSNSGEAVVIDPAWDGRLIHTEAKKRRWEIGQLWYTHAHFDHFAGAAELAEVLHKPDLPVALHQEDLELLKHYGLGRELGFEFVIGPLPSLDLAVIHTLMVGRYTFRAEHAPGHTPGLCIFHCAEEKVLFSGDLIFRHSVGRTDLPGGDAQALSASIREKIFTLPEETRILPGHGPETTVEEEKYRNPLIHV